MYEFDSELRDRLFFARLLREVGHRGVVREHAVTRRLHAEMHEAAAEARRLRRRATWLLKTGRPLPRTVKP